MNWILRGIISLASLILDNEAGCDGEEEEEDEPLPFLLFDLLFIPSFFLK